MLPGATKFREKPRQSLENAQPAWLLKKAAESGTASNLFYVFVSLPKGGEPSFYVVPCRIVASYIKRFHKQWLNEPKRDGTPRKDTTMRLFADPEGAYHDRWELLKLGA
jgi:hypothetical protein